MSSSQTAAKAACFLLPPSNAANFQSPHTMISAAAAAGPATLENSTVTRHSFSFHRIQLAAG